ncbi:hypothetical protein HPB49_011436 [Dermacentor silvarum]|uniref:Uncharacterized protein n=1 Tax=Dermacentor silvarum TaxID=543639 RepID=A0ACB8CWV1_DERSI|nr:hypothetical protein HPB49_011436 [Dermacentor silvarum]
MIMICLNTTHNILVISPPDETTATKIAKIKVLTINGKRHETNAYVSATEQMVKGIIRNILLKYTQDQLMHALVNTRNPSLKYAKRFGSTTTVILLYEGNRVPTWAYFISMSGRVNSTGMRFTNPLCFFVQIWAWVHFSAVPLSPSTSDTNK